MYRSIRLPAIALCLIIPIAADAESGTVPGAADVAPTMPERGMTMQAVQRDFGRPAEVVDAVGEPPITRWVYEGYTVYFDHHHVIHSVRTDAPATARGVGPAGRGDAHVATR